MADTPQRRRELETSVSARDSGSAPTAGILAVLGVVVLSAALAAERVHTRELSLSSWILLTGQIASGPLHLLAAQMTSGASLIELSAPILIGAVLVHQIWRGISQRRSVALGVAIALWVLIGYTSSVLMWEI